MSPTQVMPQEWISLGGETQEEGVGKGASRTGHYWASGLCAQAWKPGSQHAGEKRGVAGLLLGRAPLLESHGQHPSPTTASGK